MRRWAAQIHPQRRWRRSDNLYYRRRPVPRSHGEAIDVPKTLVRFFHTILAYLPYPIGVAWAHWIAGNAWARRLFFTRHIRLIQDVYEDGCGIRLDDGAIHRLLMAKTLKRCRLYKVPKFSDRELERYVRITGPDKVRELNGSGRLGFWTRHQLTRIGLSGRLRRKNHSSGGAIWVPSPCF